jgi:KamA family protein
MSQIFIPRGIKAQLPDGGLMEFFPPYLSDLIAKTGGSNGPIGKQFVAQPELERKFTQNGESDPLSEDSYEVAPGLVYKHRSGVFNSNEKFSYNGRALWTVTRHCAAYCRFCTRGREVGAIQPNNLTNKSKAAVAHTPHLSISEINQTLEFIEKEPGLTEIILSGGDPLTIDPETLDYIFSRLATLQQNKKLSIIRIGTRVPVHNPFILKNSHYKSLKLIKNLRIMLHVNHPLELTPETKEVIQKLREETGAILMSHSVLLKGVNDSIHTLYELFTQLAEEGVVPYYLFQNDPVYWAKHFTVPMKDAITIWGKLRPILSGVAATARFVIDTPSGYGKVSLPEGNSWDVNYDEGFKDFKGKDFVLFSKFKKSNSEIPK